MCLVAWSNSCTGTGVGEDQGREKRIGNVLLDPAEYERGDDDGDEQSSFESCLLMYFFFPALPRVEVGGVVGWDGMRRDQTSAIIDRA